MRQGNIFTSVSDSVHRAGLSGRHPLWQTPLLGRHLPTADKYCSWRYASYWNAFLFVVFPETSSVSPHVASLHSSGRSTINVEIPAPFTLLLNSLPSATKLRRSCFHRRVTIHGGRVPGPGGGAWSGGPGLWGCLVPGRDGYCCGRYASYWNAFLSILCFFLAQTV